ncbi:MAG TPA: hypothetical protein VFT51_12595 [Bacillales bacterium]|nr:hypothetical protein [Bacillales bacterium]
MQALVNLIEWLFSSKKTLIYMTFMMKDYYKVTGKLKAEGVKYRVATFSQHTPGDWGDQNNEYKIYIKKEDKHRAQAAIHQK